MRAEGEAGLLEARRKEGRESRGAAARAAAVGARR